MWRKASLETTNLALRGASWRKAPFGGALEGKPDFKLKNSVEYYLWRKAELQTTNLALRGALWRKAAFKRTNFGAARRFVALSGTLNNKFGVARCFVAQSGALRCA